MVKLSTRKHCAQTLPLCGTLGVHHLAIRSKPTYMHVSTDERHASLSAGIRNLELFFFAQGIAPIALRDLPLEGSGFAFSGASRASACETQR